MATERQILANRANAAKSTGPITPEGKRASSQNARHDRIATTVVLKGESMPRFNELASALILQFQPRNSIEAFLVQTMIAARWRLFRLWGMQTAGFELEMARTLSSHPSAGTGAALAAIAFRNLADNSRVLALQLRLETAYSREFNRALALLLKSRQAPDSSVPLDPPLQIATETWDDDSQTEPNFDADPAKDPTCNEQVTPPAPRLEPIPISPKNGGAIHALHGDGCSPKRQRGDSAPTPPRSDAPAPSNSPSARAENRPPG